MCPWEETLAPFAWSPIFQPDQRRTQSNQQHRPTQKQTTVLDDSSLIGFLLILFFNLGM